MKQLFQWKLCLLSLAFLACNQGGAHQEEHAQKVNDSKVDTAEHVSVTNDQDIKAVSVVFTDVDPKVASSMKMLVDHYLHIKNALANDDASEAANGAKALQQAIEGLDKSWLSAEQKKAYDGLEEVLKEKASQIAKGGDKIEQQRTNFVGLSEAVYNLAKQFGGGRPLYHDHCPMARDNQGAMWVSEVKEIKNPYFGASMFKCGRVEEVIQ